MYKLKQFKTLFYYYLKVVKGIFFFSIPNFVFIFNILKYQIMNQKKIQYHENIFLITSCINPFNKNHHNHNINHSKYDRFEELIKTIASIKNQKINNLFIIVVDNSIIDNEMREFLNEKIDLYIDISNDSLIKLANGYKNKGVPWATSVMMSLKKIYQYDFKFLHVMSGRYYLNDEYDYTKFINNRFNFRYYKNFLNVSTRYFCLHDEGVKYLLSLFKKIIILSSFNISCEDNMFHMINKKKSNLIDSNIGLSGKVNGIHQIDE